MQEALQAILDRLIARGIVGASLTVAGADQRLTVTAGLADRPHGVPVARASLFKLGSCSKTFVAATMMMLVQDGVVALDMPITQWFPALPKSDRITIRHLLTHRSGLPEFEFDMPMDGARAWTPAQIIEFALEARPQTDPAERFVAYCNTGYVVAGLLIQIVTGDSLAGQIRKRVLTPLGLHDTWSPAGEAFPHARLARGYYLRPPPSPGLAVADGGEMWNTEGLLDHSDALQDATALFAHTGAFAAGDMIGTSMDQVAFLEGLFDHRILSPGLLAQMADGRSPAQFPGTRMTEAGAGLFLMRYGGREVLGHQGSMPGYVTVMFHLARPRLTVALTTNTGAGNRLTLQATALHDTLDEVVQAMLG